MSCGSRVTIWADREPMPVKCTRGWRHDGPHRNAHMRYGWNQGAKVGMFYACDCEAEA